MIAACRPGAKVVDLCTLGDKHMAECAPRVGLGGGGGWSRRRQGRGCGAQPWPTPHPTHPTPPNHPLHASSACAKVFKGKKIEKGVAFPTCVSPNSVVGHFCPLADDGTALAEGDVIKM